MAGIAFLAVTPALILLAPENAPEGLPAAGEQSGAPPSVAVVPVKRSNLVQWRVSQGIAEAVQKRYLTFEAAGTVAEIGIDAAGAPLREGSRVEGPGTGNGGQVLARLDDREACARLLQAEAEHRRTERRLAVAEAAFDQARSELVRANTLAARGIASRKAAEAAEIALRTAQAELNAARAEVDSAGAQVRQAVLLVGKMTLRAPFDGRLSLVNLRVGDHIEGAAVQSRLSREKSAAMVLVNDGVFEITLNLPLRDAGDLAPGQRVLASGNAPALAQAAGTEKVHPDVGSGEIWSVSPSIGLGSRAVQVKVRVHGGDIRDGMFATVWIAATEASDVLTLPRSALSYNGQNPFVFIASGSGPVVERRKLALGLETHERVAVLTGLTDGDRVVVAGQHLLDDGMAVRIVQSPPPGAGQRTAAAGRLHGNAPAGGARP